MSCIHDGMFYDGPPVYTGRRESSAFGASGRLGAAGVVGDGLARIRALILRVAQSAGVAQRLGPLRSLRHPGASAKPHGRPRRSAVERGGSHLPPLWRVGSAAGHAAVQVVHGRFLVLDHRNAMRVRLARRRASWDGAFTFFRGGLGSADASIGSLLVGDAELGAGIVAGVPLELAKFAASGGPE